MHLDPRYDKVDPAAARAGATLYTTVLAGLVLVGVAYLVGDAKARSQAEDLAEARQRIDASAAARSEEEERADAFVRKRFLVLIESANSATAPRIAIRARHLGMNRHDLEALRAGERPVLAGEMLRICDYYAVALGDFLNPDYPLPPGRLATAEALAEADGLTAGQWLAGGGGRGR